MKISAAITVSRRPRTDNKAELASVITATTMQMGLKDFDQAVKDLKGAGIVVGESQMTIEASKVNITNNGTTAALFENGKVKADYIDATTIVTEGIKAQTIDAGNATLENLTVTDANFTGSVRSNIALVGPDSKSTSSDYWSLDTSSTTNYDWAPTKDKINPIGRTIHIFNYMYNGKLQDGTSTLTLTDGSVFFENGIKKTKIKISRQGITLFGLGDGAKFLGWVVIDRVDVATTYGYGMPLRCLAAGKVTVYDDGTNIKLSAHYHSFDGTEGTITRTNVGFFHVALKGKWFSNSDDVMISLTGIGKVYTHQTVQKASSYCKATLDNVDVLDGTSFDVIISDDETQNDGSFSFMIYNCSDFNWSV